MPGRVRLALEQAHGVRSTGEDAVGLPQVLERLREEGIEAGRRTSG